MATLANNRFATKAGPAHGKAAAENATFRSRVDDSPQPLFGFSGLKPRKSLFVHKDIVEKRTVEFGSKGKDYSGLVVCDSWDKKNYRGFSGPVFKPSAEEDKCFEYPEYHMKMVDAKIARMEEKHRQKVERKLKDQQQKLGEAIRQKKESFLKRMMVMPTERLVAYDQKRQHEINGYIERLGSLYGTSAYPKLGVLPVNVRNDAMYLHICQMYNEYNEIIIFDPKSTIDVVYAKFLEYGRKRTINDATVNKTTAARSVEPIAKKQRGRPQGSKNQSKKAAPNGDESDSDEERPSQKIPDDAPPLDDDDEEEDDSDDYGPYGNNINKIRSGKPIKKKAGAASSKPPSDPVSDEPNEDDGSDSSSDNDESQRIQDNIPDDYVPSEDEEVETGASRQASAQVDAESANNNSDLVSPGRSFSSSRVQDEPLLNFTQGGPRRSQRIHVPKNTFPSPGLTPRRVRSTGQPVRPSVLELLESPINPRRGTNSPIQRPPPPDERSPTPDERSPHPNERSSVRTPSPLQTPPNQNDFYSPFQSPIASPDRRPTAAALADQFRMADNPRPPQQNNFLVASNGIYVFSCPKNDVRGSAAVGTDIFYSNLLGTVIRTFEDARAAREYARQYAGEQFLTLKIKTTNGFFDEVFPRPENAPTLQAAREILNAVAIGIRTDNTESQHSLAAALRREMNVFGAEIRGEIATIREENHALVAAVTENTQALMGAVTNAVNTINIIVQGMNRANNGAAINAEQIIVPPLRPPNPLPPRPQPQAVVPPPDDAPTFDRITRPALVALKAKYPNSKEFAYQLCNSCVTKQESLQGVPEELKNELHKLCYLGENATTTAEQAVCQKSIATELSNQKNSILNGLRIKASSSSVGMSAVGLVGSPIELELQPTPPIENDDAPPEGIQYFVPKRISRTAWTRPEDQQLKQFPILLKPNGDKQNYTIYAQKNDAPGQRKYSYFMINALDEARINLIG